LDLSDLLLDNLSPKREKVSHVLASDDDDDEALPAVLLLGSKDVPRKNAAGRRRKLRQHGPAAAVSSQASAAAPRISTAARKRLSNTASASISVSDDDHDDLVLLVALDAAERSGRIFVSDDDDDDATQPSAKRPALNATAKTSARKNAAGELSEFDAELEDAQRVAMSVGTREYDNLRPTGGTHKADPGDNFYSLTDEEIAAVAGYVSDDDGESGNPFISPVLAMLRDIHETEVGYG
jgi:hypothetical protein